MRIIATLAKLCNLSEGANINNTSALGFMRMKWVKVYKISVMVHETRHYTIHLYLYYYPTDVLLLLLEWGWLLEYKAFGFYNLRNQLIKKIEI